MASHADEYELHYRKAEEARKDGIWEKAASHYADAIRHVERADEAPEAVEPEPYRKCAKMLYHVGEDEVAVQLLERYLSLGEACDDSAAEDIDALRDRLASEEMQRQPWRYDTS